MKFAVTGTAVFWCFLWLFMVQPARALDGSLGSRSVGTAHISLFVAPRVSPVSDTMTLSSSPTVSGNNLIVGLDSNVDPVDYMVKPTISGSNSDLGTFDMQSSGVIVKGVMDDIQRQYRETGEQVTLVLVAQQRP